ncbi:MAG: hypothetical protein ICCCNLDF_01600 [Planctomycetes bacterium]|nr:hypothetical protein [Planctomycetota bacterium]
MRKAFDLRPLEFNDVLGRGFSLFMANFVGALRWMLICWALPMLAVAVLFYFALEPYDWAGRIEAEAPGVLEPSRYAVYYWLLKLAGVGFAFSTGASGIYYMTARVYVGGNPTLSEVMRAVYSRFGHVAGTAFLHVVVVAGLTLLCWAPPFVLWDADEKGMAVLVGFVGWTAWLPLLLWYNSVYGLNTVVVMLDDAQASESYPRSAYLTKRARMRLIGVLFVVTLVVGAPGIPGLLAIPGAVLETLALEQGWPLLGVVVNLAWDAVLLPLFFMPLVVYYFDMRCRKESYDLAVMARNFGIEEGEMQRYRFNPGLGYVPKGWKGERARRQGVRKPAPRPAAVRHAQAGMAVAQPHWGPQPGMPGAFPGGNPQWPPVDQAPGGPQPPQWPQQAPPQPGWPQQAPPQWPQPNPNPPPLPGVRRPGPNLPPRGPGRA